MVVVAVAAVIVVAAVAGGLALAGRDEDRSAAPPAPAAPAPVGTGAAATTSSGPAPVGTPTTSPAVTPAVTSAAPARAAMPDLVGKNAAAARIELERLGFSDVRFGSQDAADPDVVLPQNWTVTRQSTAAGAQVPTDTAIVLTCARRV